MHSVSGCPIMLQPQKDICPLDSSFFLLSYQPPFVFTSFSFNLEPMVQYFERFLAIFLKSPDKSIICPTYLEKLQIWVNSNITNSDLHPRYSMHLEKKYNQSLVTILISSLQPELGSQYYPTIPGQLSA